MPSGRYEMCFAGYMCNAWKQKTSTVSALSKGRIQTAAIISAPCGHGPVTPAEFGVYKITRARELSVSALQMSTGVWVVSPGRT